MFRGLQSSSSNPLGQSGCPSQRHASGIHLPPSPQLKWSVLHETLATKELQQNNIQLHLIQHNTNVLGTIYNTPVFDSRQLNCIWYNTIQLYRIHSFIWAISLAPLQAHYNSEALRTQHKYCVRVSRQSTTGNCEWKTCPRSLHGSQSGIRTHDPSKKINKSTNELPRPKYNVQYNCIWHNTIQVLYLSFHTTCHTPVFGPMQYNFIRYNTKCIGYNMQYNCLFIHCNTIVFDKIIQLYFNSIIHFNDD